MITLGLLTSIVVTPSAHADAGTCSTSDACGTYAVLDSANNVTNIIVCQPSVCGGGTFGDNRVVLQMPTDKNGDAQAGYFAGNNAPNPITYNPTTRVFTETHAPNSLAYPSDTNPGDVLSATVTKQSQFQAPLDIYGPTPPIVTSTASASISATDGLLTQVQYLTAGLSEDELSFLMDNNADKYIIGRNKLELIRLLISLGY